MAPRPDEHDVDPHLTRSLRLLGDRYGALGVALAAARLTDPAALVRQLSAITDERPAWSRPTLPPPALADALIAALRDREQSG